MKITRVLIADDHPVVRSAVRTLLEAIDEIEVVAEAADGAEALRLVEEHHPDILYLDLTMPGLNGLNVLDQVSKKFPEVSTIVLTVHDSEEYARRAFELGAMGYLAKSAAANELELAIQTVSRREKYLSAGLSKKILLEHALDAAEGRSPITPLTPRQLQVLRLVVEGHTTKEIALALNISVKTVETHRSQLRERLNIWSVAGLVRYAMRMGLMENKDGS